MFFKLIKVRFLVRKFYIYQNARCNIKKKYMNYYVCIYIYIYMYMYVYMHLCVYVCVYVG